MFKVENLWICSELRFYIISMLRIYMFRVEILYYIDVENSLSCSRVHGHVHCCQVESLWTRSLLSG